MIRIHRRTLLLLALAGWVIVVLVWATQPATDHVPTLRADGTVSSISVECTAPLDTDAAPTGPLPALQPGEVLQHTPCENQHLNNQIALVIDLLAAVAAVALVVALARRRRRHHHPDPTPANA